MRNVHQLGLCIAAAFIVAFAASAQTTLNPTADTYVRDGTYAGSNFGTSASIEVKNNTSVGYSRHAYLKFDTTGVSGSLSSAKLRLYGRHSETAGTISIAAYSVADTAWSETGMTWNNKPAMGASALSTINVGTTSTYYEWDVTSYVNSERSAGRNTVSLGLKGTLSFNPTGQFNSDEAGSNRAQLVLSTGTTPACGSASSGPTDNPVATKYGSSAYPWTGNIKWNCVYNINDYSGANMETRFNSARDAASANGGGIVYFPAGTHNFTQDIQLKNGVVIRGANPSISDAKNASFSPPSKLIFPKYNPSLSGSGTPNTTAFKMISTVNTNTDSNIGIVNVDLNRAYIRIVASNPATQANRNILMFGIRNNNAADPGGAYGGAGVPLTTYNGQPFQNAWQRWPNRAMPNIKINAYENILIANNRINDAITDSYDQPGFKVRDGTTIITLTDGSKARFDYADHTGLNVNRADDTGYVVSGTPATEPMLFRKGVVIRDNWIYQTMWSAIHAAGDGLIIKDNVKTDLAGKTKYVDPSGQRKPHNSATFENRGIDWSGYNVIVEGNNYTVHRTRINDGPYYSVDGEGILLQACCGGTLANGATVRNNTGNAYVGLWKTREINNVLITANTVNNGTGEGIGIYVDANVSTTEPFKVLNTRVEGNTTHQSIDMLGDVAGGTGNTILNNANPSGTSRSISYSCETAPTVSGNSGFTVQACK